MSVKSRSPPTARTHAMRRCPCRGMRALAQKNSDRTPEHLSARRKHWSRSARIFGWRLGAKKTIAYNSNWDRSKRVSCKMHAGRVRFNSFRMLPALYDQRFQCSRLLWGDSAGRHRWIIQPRSACSRAKKGPKKWPTVVAAISANRPATDLSGCARGRYQVRTIWGGR